MQRVLSPDQLIPHYSTDARTRVAQIEAEPLPASVPALLAAAAAEVPDRPVWHFIDSGRAMRYGELAASVARLAGGLQRAGVRQGSHVGVMLPNVPEFPVTWLAIAWLGAVMVPINIGYTARELDYVLEDAEVEHLVIGAGFLPTLAAARAQIRGALVAVGEGERDAAFAKGALLDWAALEAGAACAAAEVAPDELLNIQYTSGTTGFPKGCMLSQRYWLCTGRVNAFRDGVRYERILISTPFYYMDPQWLLLMAFYQRATVFVAERQSASRFVSWLREYRIHFCLFPEAAWKQPPDAADARNEVRRANVYGLRPMVHAALEQRFGLNAREAFGMTEIGSTLFMPLSADDMIGSGACGIEGPFRRCRVVDGEGRDLPDGEIGELVVSGPGVLQGYYGKPDATRAAFFGEWFRTGDLFRRDARGFHFIVGRQKDMIRRSAENISAREVEAVLREMDAVADVAAVPVPDDLRREEVKVYLVLREGLTPAHCTPQQVTAHAAQFLAAFKVPRYIEYCSEFPRTPSGKVKKHELLAARKDLRAGSWDRTIGAWR